MINPTIFFSEEQVLPEKVDSPNARRIIVDKASVMLTRDEATWLRDALIEMLAIDEEW